MVSIRTNELLLEPLTAAHATEMYELLADPLLYRHLDAAPPPSVDHVRETYARWERRASPDGQEIWLNWVVRLHLGAAVGFVQATLMPPASASIAYVIGSEFWGRGYACSATRAMLEHLVESYGTKEFLATVEAENVRSIALLERLAFVPASAEFASGQDLAATERLYVRSMV